MLYVPVGHSMGMVMELALYSKDVFARTFAPAIGRFPRRPASLCEGEAGPAGQGGTRLLSTPPALRPFAQVSKEGTAPGLYGSCGKSLSNLILGLYRFTEERGRKMPVLAKGKNPCFHIKPI